MTMVRHLVAQLRARSYFDHPKYGVVVKAGALATVISLVHALASTAQQPDPLGGFAANMMATVFVEVLPLAMIGAAIATGWFAAARTQSPALGWIGGAAVLVLLLSADFAVEGSLGIERWLNV